MHITGLVRGRSWWIASSVLARHDGLHPWRVVQTGAECTMPSTPPPPTADRVRLTISVTPEVHSTFQRLANAGSMSISRAMGEWLGDTIDAASFMAEKMEQARAAPKLVARELHAYALGLADETSQVLQAVRKGALLPSDLSSAVPPTGRATGARRANPPSSNTGGKGTRKGAGDRS